MQYITLPFSKKKAAIKDYVSHGAQVAYQKAMFQGVNVNFANFKPSMEDLTEQFGAEEMKRIDAIPNDEERKMQIAALTEKYILSKVKMEDVGLANIESANSAKMLMMVVEIDGKKPTNEDINDLHQDDYLTILRKIEEIEKLPLEVKSSTQSFDILPESTTLS